MDSSTRIEWKRSNRGDCVAKGAGQHFAYTVHRRGPVLHVVRVLDLESRDLATLASLPGGFDYPAFSVPSHSKLKAMQAAQRLENAKNAESPTIGFHSEPGMPTWLCLCPSCGGSVFAEHRRDERCPDTGYSEGAQVAAVCRSCRAELALDDIDDSVSKGNQLKQEDR